MGVKGKSSIVLKDFFSYSNSIHLFYFVFVGIGWCRKEKRQNIEVQSEVR